VSGSNNSYIVTLAERQTRYLILAKIACPGHPLGHRQASQIKGAPDWSTSVRYDVVLSAPESSFAGPFPQGDAQAQLMLRALLAERFKLVVHRESGSILAADLILAPSGIKMTRVAPDR
jgi:uncharacterized protein (TIGR03435 family)